MAVYVYNSSDGNRTDPDVLQPQLTGCWVHEDSQLRECLDDNVCLSDVRKTGQSDRISLFCCCRTHDCNRRMIISDDEMYTGK